MTHDLFSTARRISAAIMINQELKRIAARLDREIAAITGERLPFSLFLWTEGRANYVSNSPDRDVIKEAMLMTISKWDAETARKSDHQTH